MLLIRRAEERDIPEILIIYNQGIEDRIATLEMDQKDEAYMTDWFRKHQGRYIVLVAEDDRKMVGWAAINPYSVRMMALEICPSISIDRIAAKELVAGS